MSARDPVNREDPVREFSAVIAAAHGFERATGRRPEGVLVHRVSPLARYRGNSIYGLRVVVGEVPDVATCYLLVSVEMP